MAGPDSRRTPSERRTRSRRQAIRFLAGLALLLFAGYAVGWRSMRLAPENVLVLLGEEELAAGCHASFRLIGLAPGGGRYLPLTGVDLTMERDGERVVLARRLPRGGVVDLDVEIPAWPAGPARLLARVDTGAGSTLLRAEVRIVSVEPGAFGPRKGRVLLLSRPSAEWIRPPTWTTRSVGPLADEQGGAPAVLQVFPEGGTLAGEFPARMLVRVSDRSGRPLAGRLWVDGHPAGRVDAEGLAFATLEPGSSGPVELRFEGPTGVLAGEFILARDDAPFDLAVRPRRVAAGSPLEVQVSATAETGELYLDAWWTGGWCATGRTSLQGGRAAMVLPVPGGIEGPLVIRLRSDPFGRDARAVRRAVVWVGRGGAPVVSAAFMGLISLTPDGAFWSEAAGLLTGGRASLVALMSRIRAPEGALPVLTDNRREVQRTDAGRRSPTAVFALWLVGISSALLFGVLAWLVLPGARGRKSEARRRYLLWSGITLGAAAIVLAAGWIWLFLSCR